MCTVTYITAGRNRYITSNRDIECSRMPALTPVLYAVRDGSSLLYPKDPQGGGSWITLKNNGHAGVLLNGAFHNHQPSAHYVKSRGLHMLEIMEAGDPLAAFQRATLNATAPFTLILLLLDKLVECRWDADRKHVRFVAPDQPHIWSSSTLYDAAASKKRHDWFAKWQQLHPCPTQEEIIHFHRNAGKHDQQDGLVMNRNNQVQTVSITTLRLWEDGNSLQYIDLLSGNVSAHRFDTAADFIHPVPASHEV